MSPRFMMESIPSIVVLLALNSAAFCEQLELRDLVGLDISATIHRAQDIKREGRAVSMKADQQWLIAVNADNTIETTVDTTFHTPQGSRKAPTNSGSFTLDETSDVRSRGGGKGAWTFAGSTLTFTRTFPKGAYRANFDLSRSGDKISCVANEAFAREENSNIVMQSPFGGEVTMLSAKQLSSQCSVKRR